MNDKTRLPFIKSVYHITGMSCSSCVQVIEDSMAKLPEVNSAKVDLDQQLLEILSEREITLSEVSKALTHLPKYSVNGQIKSKAILTQRNWLATYKPLLIIVIYVLSISLAYQSTQRFFNIHLFMNHCMAGFFISLSYFKFLDLSAFSQSFSEYDPVARYFSHYGKIYPFIEFLLGFLFIADVGLIFAEVLTILVLSLTTVGIYKKLQSKSSLQCACLGSSFNLPLSRVTILENVVMIGMAMYGLVF